MTNKIISISGRISSGKSLVSTSLSSKYSIPVASFGGYLVGYSKERALPLDRESLQDLGKRFLEVNSELFLKSVIDYFSVDSKIIILEGVRHKVIYDLLRKNYSLNISVYVDAKPEIRYERYLKRNKASDMKVTYEEFLVFDNHAVEMETESLKEFSEVIIDNNVEMNIMKFDFTKIEEFICE